MKTLTIRDFRTRPRQAQKTLALEGEAILTSNGRPVALMVGVDSDSLDEALEVLRRARGLQALRLVRGAARSGEVDRLGVRKIEALIRKTRSENRRRR
jgi:antitoxin (DNA-binding transcriptional repressor) of toxin-antitoxin stability system